MTMLKRKQGLKMHTPEYAVAWPKMTKSEPGCGIVQVRMRSSKSWSAPMSLLSMSTLTSEPESTGVLKRMTEGFHTAPSCDSIVIVQCGPVTVTGAVAPETTCVPLPVAAPAMVKRCGRAALFDLTDTVQVPCMASDICLPP